MSPVRVAGEIGGMAELVDAMMTLLKIGWGTESGFYISRMAKYGKSPEKKITYWVPADAKPERKLAAY